MTRSLKKYNFFCGFFMLLHLIVVEAKAVFSYFIHLMPGFVALHFTFVGYCQSVRQSVCLSIFFCIFVLFFCFVVFFSPFFLSVFFISFVSLSFLLPVFLSFCLAVLLSLYISVFPFFYLLFFSYYLSVTKKKNMVVDDYEPYC